MAGSNFGIFPTACSALVGKHLAKLCVPRTGYALPKTMCDGLMVIVAEIDLGTVLYQLPRKFVIPVLALVGNTFVQPCH